MSRGRGAAPLIAGLMGLHQDTFHFSDIDAGADDISMKFFEHEHVKPLYFH
jgi:hypothetical protein